MRIIRLTQLAALRKRANEFAAEAAKPMLLEVAFKSLLHAFHLPPAFPGEEFEMSQEPQACCCT